MFKREKIPQEIKARYQLPDHHSKWQYDIDSNAGLIRVGAYGVGTPSPGGSQNYVYLLIWKNEPIRIITKELTKTMESSPIGARLYEVSHELRPIEAPEQLEVYRNEILNLVNQAFTDFGFSGSPEKAGTVSIQLNKDRPIVFV
jgi:hypothetical protein